MLSFRGDYRQAANEAANDSRFSESERSALAKIGENDESVTSSSFGTGRRFAVDNEEFLFHTSTDGTNIGVIQ